MTRTMSIGIPIVGSADWLGGVSYIELLIKALLGLPPEERPAVHLVVLPGSLQGLDMHAHLIPLVDSVVFLSTSSLPRVDLNVKTHVVPSYDKLFSLIDFLFPINFSDGPRGYPAGFWVPDFQHRRLPEFFTEQDRAGRDAVLARITSDRRLLVLSSNASLSDFREFFPHSPAHVRVLHFYKKFDDAWTRSDPVAVQKRYGLPDSFLICSNQFWAHKNHATLFEAIKILKDRGTPVPLVCTGSTADYRSRQFYDQLMARTRELGIDGLLFNLGLIPRDDQIQLMRRSMALVQPSLFEGWSTVVEDARCLGKIMFLSDIDVHKEQAPRDCVFFKRTDPNDLAGKISQALGGLSPGPGRSAEIKSRAASMVLTEEYARQFVSIATEAAYIYGRKPSSMSQALWNLTREPALNGTSDSTTGDPRQEADAHNVRAEELFRGGKPAEARALLLNALELAPEHHRTLNNLGVVAFSTSEYPEALKFFLRALETDPHDRNAVLNTLDLLKEPGSGLALSKQELLRIEAGVRAYLNQNSDDREVVEALSAVVS